MAKAMVTDNNGNVVTTNIEFLEDNENVTAYDKMVADLQEALSDVSSDVNLSIYRHPRGKGPQTFCETVPPDKYTVEQLLMYIKNKYGGGEYRLRMHVPGEQGFKINKLVCIEDEKKSEIISSNDSVTSQLLGYLDRMNDQLLGMNQQDNGGRMQFMQEMLLMKKIFDQPQQNSMNGISELVALIGALKELGLFGENVGDNDSMGGFLNKMSGPLMQIMQGTANQTQNVPPQLRHQLTNSQYGKAPVPVDNKIQNPVPSELEQKSGLIQKIVQLALSGAIKNSEPALYADFIVDQIPDDMLEQFGAIVFSESWFEYLCASEPQVRDYKDWFTKLRDEIKAATLDDNENDLSIDGNSARSGGHSENAQNYDGDG